ncbi:hypothetical protein Tco_1113399 [Tanacetum coccineum]|uniref:Uncharacterized protein n=1 Tax=Tanacetum coccineum TaxID=301880 RepID=A0ABQ5ISM1_9ASTR
MCSMIVKDIEVDGMAHESGSRFEGEEQDFNLKEDEVVPKVEDVSLVDGVFNGALGGGGDGDDDFAIEEREEEEEKCDEDDEENEEGDHYLIKSVGFFRKSMDIVRNDSKRCLA